jgi:hypothetical protein
LVVEPLGTYVRIEKAGSDAEPVLLRTEMTMFDQVPAVGGVAPSSLPVYTENVAHDGLLMIEKRSVDAATAGSRAVGVKLYQPFTPKVVLGVPEIVGAASTTLLRSMRPKIKTKNLANAPPEMGARRYEVRMDNPRGYDTGADSLRTRGSTHPHQQSAVPPDSSWSAIACMELVDVTECSLVGGRS